MNTTSISIFGLLKYNKEGAMKLLFLSGEDSSLNKITKQWEFSTGS